METRPVSGFYMSFWVKFVKFTLKVANSTQQSVSPCLRAADETRSSDTVSHHHKLVTKRSRYLAMIEASFCCFFGGDVYETLEKAKALNPCLPSASVRLETACEQPPRPDKRFRLIHDLSLHPTPRAEAEPSV